MTAALLTMNGVVKRFGGVQALRGVDFELRAGEIHALLGENGAGKSTLMNILSGVHAPDEGTVTLDGAPVRFANPREAQAAGIATIFQELDLVPGLDVAANLFLCRELVKPGGFLDVAGMREEARKRLTAIELDIDVERPVGELSIGHRQVVAIVKALSYASRVLIMDEPTAALGPQETAQVGELIKQLKAEGIGIFLISHDIHDVFDLADRVCVMKNGRVVGTAWTKDVTKDEVLGMIILGKCPPAAVPGPGAMAAA
jgi:ribose transport system ATP-binding protein